MQARGVEKRGQVTLRDITFAGAPGAEPVHAYLVAPPGKGPFAGALFVHWLGEPKTTNRTQFLQEAVELAGRGTVSLLVDAMWAKPKWFRTRTCEKDFEAAIRQVVELRRALDLLIAQPGVEPTSVAVSGSFRAVLVDCHPWADVSGLVYERGTHDRPRRWGSRK